MRDPITKLAIIDGGSLDPELCKKFADIFMIPERLAVVHYISPITKKSHTFFSSNDKRIMIVTDQCVYICREDTGQRRRCIRIRAINEVMLFSDSFIGLRIPAEHDMVLRLASAAETEYFLNILRVVQDVCYGRQLQVTAHKGTYKDSGLNLVRPDNYIATMVPFTFLSAPDAHEDALDELLRPPPPPVPGPAGPAQPSLTPEAAVVLHHPLLDPNTVAPISAALKRAVSTAQQQNQLLPPLSTGRGGSAPRHDDGTSAVEEKLQRLSLLESELTQRTLAMEDAQRRNAVVSGEASPPYRSKPFRSNQQGGAMELDDFVHSRSGATTPPPHLSVITPHADNMSPILPSLGVDHGAASAGTTRQVQQQQQQGSTTTGGGGGDSLSPRWGLPQKPPPVAVDPRVDTIQNTISELQRRREDDRKALDEQLKAVRGELIDADRRHEQRQVDMHLRHLSELEPLPKDRSHPRVGVTTPTLHHPVPLTAASGGDGALSSSMRTPSAFTTVGQRPPATSSSMAPSTSSSRQPFQRRGPSVAEFESSIGTRPLKERLVLRQYQIDEKRREIQRLFNDSSTYDAIAVAALQEDLVALVKKLEADLVEVDSQASSRAESPNPRGPSSGAVGGSAPTASSIEVPPPPPPATTSPAVSTAGWANAAQSVVAPPKLNASSSGPSQQPQQPPPPQGQAPPGSSAAGWEWTPERTAEYWAWVSVYYQQAAAQGHAVPPPPPSSFQQYGAKASHSRSTTPTGGRRGGGAPVPRYADPTQSSARHDRRVASPAATARAARAGYHY